MKAFIFVIFLLFSISCAERRPTKKLDAHPRYRINHERDCNLFENKKPTYRKIL